MSFNILKTLGLNHLAQQIRPSVTQLISIALSTGAVTDIITKVANSQPVTRPELMLAGTTVLASFCRATIPNLSGLTPTDSHSLESQLNAITQGAAQTYLPAAENVLASAATTSQVGPSEPLKAPSSGPTDWRQLVGSLVLPQPGTAASAPAPVSVGPADLPTTKDTILEITGHADSGSGKAS